VHNELKSLCLFEVCIKVKSRWLMPLKMRCGNGKSDHGAAVSMRHAINSILPSEKLHSKESLFAIEPSRSEDLHG
jgi:hypothetical protein